MGHWQKVLAAALVIVGADWLACPAPAQSPPKLGIYALPPDLAAELGDRLIGAEIYRVVPASPAGQSGIRPGDVITAVNEQQVRDFSQLAAMMRSQPTGTPLVLTVIRSGAAEQVRVTPQAWIGDLNDAAYRASLAYLLEKVSRHDGPILSREIASTHWELGERTKAVAELARAIAKHVDHVGLKAQWLEWLRKTGQFEQYVQEAQLQSKRHPQSDAIGVHRIESLLVQGKCDEADKLAIELAAIAVRRSGKPTPESYEILRRWVIARLRLGKSLEPPVELRSSVRSLWTSPALAVPNFWREALKGREPYRIVGKVDQDEVALQNAKVLFGLVPYRMHGIPVKVNGSSVPLAIVDTGASHTLFNEQTARKAGITIGSTAHAAAGSLTFTARPGFIRELKIGEITLQDVPVSVGNPPPLVITKAEAAIGLDVMMHLRFTIDYGRAKVRVQSSRRMPADSERGEAWDIPLWPFSDHCLSSGMMPNQQPTRVLIDSGNFAHTLVWPMWAKSHISDHPGPTSSIIGYALTNPRHMLRGLSLAGKSLPDWPVTDMPPVTLKDVDLLDVLMGHDLLSQYVVTVDLANRRLRLVSPGEKFKLPVAPRPGLF